MLHPLTAGNLGCSPREELRMYRSTFEEDLGLIAEREGPQAADAEIDDLQRMRDDVKEGSPGMSWFSRPNKRTGQTGV